MYRVLAIEQVRGSVLDIYRPYRVSWMSGRTSGSWVMVSPEIRLTPLEGWWKTAGSPPWSAFFFSSRRRHTRLTCDWNSDVCSSDLRFPFLPAAEAAKLPIDGQPRPDEAQDGGAPGDFQGSGKIDGKHLEINGIIGS